MFIDVSLEDKLGRAIQSPLNPSQFGGVEVFGILTSREERTDSVGFSKRPPAS